MKAIAKSYSLPLFLALLLCFSCGDDSNPGDQEIKQIQEEAQAGTWRITKFEDSGNDETAHFAGFTFQFTDLGVVNATNSGTNYAGTWAITDENSDDDSSDDLHFEIFFNLTNDFEDLNDDWEILSHSATKIELIDISGGDGDTDYLTFERN